MEIKIVYKSEAIRRVVELIDRIKDSDVPIIIQGESGTGKDYFAKYIHYTSVRKDKPFVCESCGAIPPTLIESILFGHVKGAFTGAIEDRIGLFELAQGGTIVLDEIEELSGNLQVKLLRVVQEKKIKRVGGNNFINLDVRIIVSSTKDLLSLVKERKFREDLYYRLNVFNIHLPPLRERKEDIPELINFFLKKYSQQEIVITKEAEKCLLNYSWPGNIRELENEIQRLILLGIKKVTPEHLSEHIQNELCSIDHIKYNLKHNIEELEKKLIQEAIKVSKGNKTKAAKLLGLSRFGLLKKLKRYHMIE